ncbi:hypothetical protein GDO81_001048 [Engystomops pustulosus]|uniref:Uncharacterized protein n=1 Tax=Engystomops pustulosus TaxID=76066 RepID=A0AAV7DAC8_ENGPU|nr:hypothetical protein GDO81_001048 [Engystomops pustulosus]
MKLLTQAENKAPVSPYTDADVFPVHMALSSGTINGVYLKGYIDEFSCDTGINGVHIYHASEYLKHDAILLRKTRPLNSQYEHQ